MSVTQYLKFRIKTIADRTNSPWFDTICYLGGTKSILYKYSMFDNILINRKSGGSYMFFVVFSISYLMFHVGPLGAQPEMPALKPVIFTDISRPILMYNKSILPIFMIPSSEGAKKNFLQTIPNLTKTTPKNKIVFAGYRGKPFVMIALQKNIPQETIAEALQSEAAFTRASDSKYVVATYGCGPCVAVGGYDKTNQSSFIVHFATPNEVDKCGGNIFYNISLLAKKPLEVPIQLHLRGGQTGASGATIAAIKIWMRQRHDLPMTIVSEDVLDKGFAKSLFVNSKTGEVGEYDPKLNPHHRTFDEATILSCLLSAYEPNIKIAYTPKG